jgi:hypothetical protein
MGARYKFKGGKMETEGTQGVTAVVSREIASLTADENVRRFAGKIVSVDMRDKQMCQGGEIRVRIARREGDAYITTRHLTTTDRELVRLGAQEYET